MGVKPTVSDDWLVDDGWGNGAVSHSTADMARIRGWQQQQRRQHRLWTIMRGWAGTTITSTRRATFSEWRTHSGLARRSDVRETRK